MKIFRFHASALIALVTMLTSSVALSGPREVADRIAQRINGVPPSKALLDQMTTLVEQGKAKEAALLAIDNTIDPPYFYNITLPDWVAPFTNEDESNRVTLNDYSATVIGMTRDEKNFKEVLTGNFLYVGQAGVGNALTAPVAPDEGFDPETGEPNSNTVLPNYSVSNNAHYVQLETQGADLKATLAEAPQSELNGFSESAGILTSYGFGRAYYVAGTNRAATRFTFMTFLCNDMEQVSDTTRPTFRIRQDVGRAPGGNSQVFKNKCQGCHGGLDAISGAFAFWNWDEDTTTLQHTPNLVQDKFTVNADVFPQGYVTRDDSWLNLWSEGANARFGWTGAQQGNGVNSYGKLIAGAAEFSRCMAKRVYSRACVRDFESVESQEGASEIISDLASKFTAKNFNMKDLWAESVLKCPVE